MQNNNLHSNINECKVVRYYDQGGNECKAICYYDPGG